ncbi:hypothetical protein AcdelDRAFT_3879 [Acidovorax delafieldii 2AN]|uniref:Uncharacterized protein n=1 Tax=Acidovorax delafieldii 2AN TaxID=573060 RepID=C5TAE9_ACIDE|nr:hypothetical protein AcdelDRAFT_3879 [Acidovorax delafieldii 2AN]
MMVSVLRWIDTHCHFDASEFAHEVDALPRRRECLEIMVKSAYGA